MNLPHPFRLETFGEVTSTNDIIQARAADGEPEGLVVTATAQTAGRGRRGRSWSSPAGNLYCSFLLRPRPLKNDHPGTLSLVVTDPLVGLDEGLPAPYDAVVADLLAAAGPPAP